MPFPLPKLDDRSFDDLMKEARDIIRARTPSWTDFSPSDPGTILLELFAFLTQTMIYRINRVPEKVHIALLNLLGVAPLPPAAAVVTLTFSRAPEQAAKPVTLQAGTRVSDPSNSVTFETMEDAVFDAGTASATATAVHAETIEAEPLGVGTGEARQTYRLRRSPMLRDLPNLTTLSLGVEDDESALSPEMTVRQFDGRPYVIWRKVTSFLGLSDSDRAYTLDPVTGTITFSPLGGAGSATLAKVPPKGRGIRAWYRIGGGRAGNVAPGTLTVLRQAVPGISVTNAERAAGGEDGETVDQAIIRGREAVQILSSAITARDFERIATGAGGVL